MLDPKGVKVHPWITVWLNPRVTVRRVMNTGRRRDPVLVSAVWGFSAAVFFAAQPAETFPSGMKPLIVTLSLVLASLVMASVIYMNGALRAGGGRKEGGNATAGQISEAIALSMIPFVSWFVLGALLAICIRLTLGHKATAAENQQAQVWVYLFLSVGAALFVWSWILTKTCLAEAQGFTTSQLRRANSMSIKRYLLLLITAAVLLGLLGIVSNQITRLHRG